MKFFLSAVTILGACSGFAARTSSSAASPVPQYNAGEFTSEAFVLQQLHPQYAQAGGVSAPTQVTNFKAVRGANTKKAMSAAPDARFNAIERLNGVPSQQTIAIENPTLSLIDRPDGTTAVYMTFYVRPGDKTQGCLPTRQFAPELTIRIRDTAGQELAYFHSPEAPITPVTYENGGGRGLCVRLDSSRAFQIDGMRNNILIERIRSAANIIVEIGNGRLTMDCRPESGQPANSRFDNLVLDPPPMTTEAFKRCEAEANGMIFPN